MMPNRFVILHHLAPTGEHWDFMLEQKDALLTWRMMSQPTGREACPIACLRIKDHGKRYLDYEGPISGGRGFVTRIDHGRYELLAADQDTWTLRLQGQRMVGDFRLVRADQTSQARWTLIAEG